MMKVIMENKTAGAVAILALTIALLTAFQMRQVLNEREFIQQQFASQTEQLGQVDQIYKQLESLTVGTSKLAGAGNETAQAIIADLRKVGVTVNPNATAGQRALEFKQPEQPKADDKAAPAAKAPAQPAPAKTTPEKAAAPAAEPNVGN